MEPNVIVRRVYGEKEHLDYRPVTTVGMVATSTINPEFHFSVNCDHWLRVLKYYNVDQMFANARMCTDARLLNTARPDSNLLRGVATLSLLFEHS